MTTSTSGYSGTPLAKKLGLRPGAVTLLVGAPRGFEAQLEGLPEGAKVRRRAGGAVGLILWFVRSRSELERGIGKMAAAAAESGLWIIWPKQASEMRTDLKENVVRDTGLAAGLVDFKVCAVDETWSGLRFARRKEANRR